MPYGNCKVIGFKDIGSVRYWGLGLLVVLVAFSRARGSPTFFEGVGV